MNTQLNDKWIKVCSDLPESGMGFHYVDIHFANGQLIRTVIYNSSIVTYKESINVEDIVDIRAVT